MPVSEFSARLLRRAGTFCVLIGMRQRVTLVPRRILLRLKLLMSSGFNRTAWITLLEKLGEALGKDGPPVRLCVIGSAACLFGGMEGRTSRDLDVWRTASDYDRLELRRAAEHAGIEFDPKEPLEPDRPYLQIVDQGPTELGIFTPVLIDRFGRLELFRPPIENLVASKLIRGDPKDLGDIRFLVSLHRPDSDSIRQIVSKFTSRAREQARENLVYLEIFSE